MRDLSTITSPTSALISVAAMASSLSTSMAAGSLLGQGAQANADM